MNGPVPCLMSPFLGQGTGPPSYTWIPRMPRVSAAELAAIEAEYPDPMPARRNCAARGCPDCAHDVAQVDALHDWADKVNAAHPGDLERNIVGVRLYDKYDPAISRPLEGDV